MRNIKPPTIKLIHAFQMPDSQQRNHPVADRQAVRPGLQLDRKFLELAGLRVEPAELVRELAGPPDVAVARGERIMRARAERRFDRVASARPYIAYVS